MRKREGGQAFILVLILLAIGALLVIPSLRLTGTSLKSSQLVTQRTKALYAADAAQEYVMWKLVHKDWTSEFQTDGDTGYIDIDVCGVPVGITVVMKAVPGRGGITLATDDIIRPTKTVEPSVVANGYPGPYTYIIRLEQLSSDNSKGLDSVYDVLPKGLSYVNNSAQLRVDGGEWVSFPNPSIYTTGGQSRLRWPATLETYFSSPMRDFAIRQVKEIKFQATGSLGNNTKYYNWVLLNAEDVDTLSGPIAPIQTGTGAGQAGGLLQVSKASDPDLILPGVETELSYTISITNLETQTEQIYSITDYLPPDFEYLGPTSGLTTANPQVTLETINGLLRPKLYWEFSPAISIASQQTKTLAFGAKASKDVSGTYYNEVIVINKFPLSGDIFNPPDMDVGEEDFLENYSWNTGAVTVPAYDSSANTTGVIIDANLALLGLDSITITSYNVR